MVVADQVTYAVLAVQEPIMSYYLAASLDTLRTQVNQQWPHRSKISDGWIGDTAHSNRKSDHNPDWKNGGVVRALDLTATRTMAQAICDAATTDSRVAYVIFNGRIWTPSRGWYKYTGVNPHANHVHISIKHTKPAERTTTRWKLPGTSIMSVTVVDDNGVTAPQKYRVKRTSRAKVPVYANRGKSKQLAGTVGSKGYRLNVVKEDGSWTQIRWKNAHGWVATLHLEDTYEDSLNTSVLHVRAEASIRRICLRATKGTERNTTPHLVGLYQRQQSSPYTLTQDQIWGPVTDKHYRWVHRLQVVMNTWDGTKLVADGSYGNATHARILELQKNHPDKYSGRPDNIAGPKFCKMLGIPRYP